VLPTVTTVPPTPTIAATATATATPAFPITPVATLAPSEATEAIKAIEAANEMLRAAVVESSIGNMAALETLWRDEALAKAQAFAQDFNQRYLRPLEVTFVYLAPPLAIKGDSPDTAYVISTEAWNYTGPKATHDESLEFTYSLRREDEGWVIIDYTYGNAPITSPSGGEGKPTLTPAPGTITAPVVVTPAAP
jgi:hypothetical protein